MGLLTLQPEISTKGRIKIASEPGTPDLVGAHSYLGPALASSTAQASSFSRRPLCRHVKAEQEFKHALDLNPNSAIAHARYGEYLVMRRRFEEGIPEDRRAQELDPLSAEMTATQVYGYIVGHRYDEAIALGQKVVELEPNVPLYRSNIAFSYFLKGQPELAASEFEKAKDLVGPATTGNQNAASFLGWFYAVSGRRHDALKMIKEYEDLSSHSYVDFYFVAQIYAGLDDRDQAIRYLERAYQQRSNQIAWLAADPFWYPMYSDPRFKDLIRRIGLPQPE